MFFLPKSETKIAREQAENLLRLADKVDCYRRDVVPAEKLAAMREAGARLRKLWEQKDSNAEVLNLAAEELHAAMLPCGGNIYPLTVSGEYTEMIIVAAILVIGIRTFFLQPFKIPTNSMYPTYNGMTPYVYALDQPGPSVGEKAWNFVVQGAVNYDLRASASGEVTLPLAANWEAIYQYHPGRTWSRLWLVTVDQRENVLDVGGQPLKVLVPWDFESGFDEAFYQTYFPDLFKKARYDVQQMPSLLSDSGHIKHDEQGHAYVSTGRQVQAGDRVLDFDLRTGDMLFVDRFSYNFVAPKPGDPFVFHTGGIDGILTQLPDGRRVNIDQYYIKRLVGVPGNVLEVRAPMLYRDGAPATGAAEFDKNGHQEGNYPGYTNGNANSVYLHAGETFTVPPGHYFAMGDNSPTSYDSRYWGGVPAQNVVGRAVVIIYPFTFRWGLAK